MAQEVNDASLKTTTLEYNCYKQFIDQFSQNRKDFDIKLPFENDYVGPIEFTRTHDRGRSWIAKQDIPKGTLLLVEKAYICSSRNYHSYVKQYIDHLKEQYSKNKTENTIDSDIDMDNEEKDIQFDETVLLVSKLIDLLLNHPNPSNIIKDLKVLYPRETEMSDFETVLFVVFVLYNII